MVRWFAIIFLTFKSLDKIVYGVTIQMRLLWHNFCLVLLYFLQTFKKKFEGMCVTKLVLFYYSPCHWWCTAALQSQLLSWHSCDVSPFSTEQNEGQTVHHALQTKKKYSVYRLCNHFHQSKSPPANVDFFFLFHWSVKVRETGDFRVSEIDSY